MPHGVGGVVDAGERLGNRRHQAAEHDARRNGHGDELPVGVPHVLLRVPRAQHLPHDNANGIAHGKIDDAPQIEQGAANVHGRHHVQPAGGVALAQDGHAAGPEEFVDQQGHTLDGDGSQQLAGDVHGTVSAHDKGVSGFVGMRPPRHDGKLHVPGNDRGDGRALHAHFRRAEFAEDQDVVQHQIHEHRRNAAQHGNESLPGLPEGAGIGVGQGEGQKAPEHDGQIFKAVIQRPGGSGGVALAGKVKPDQLRAAQQENSRAHQRDDDTDQELKPEGVADALVILGAVELGGEDTRAGACAEDAQVEYEQQAVDDGNAAHGNGADLPDHDVVQQGHKVGDAVLDDNGDGYPKDPAVKRLVSDVTMMHKNLKSEFFILFPD